MGGNMETAIAEHEERLPEITPETKPVRAIRNDFETEIKHMINEAGTIQLTDKQEKTLYAPVDEQSVEIRPDGLIYLPWMEYVTRLKKAFGLEWCIIPQGMPKMNGNLMIWGFYLIVKGKLAGFALGEQVYHPNNYMMSYGDATEGAKSNALMRLCKGIGISLELWQPKYIRAWKEKYAETYNDKGKTKWRKISLNGDSKPHKELPNEKELKPEKPKSTFKEEMGKIAQEMETLKPGMFSNELGSLGYALVSEIPKDKKVPVYKKFKSMLENLKKDE